MFPLSAAKFLYTNNITIYYNVGHSYPRSFFFSFFFQCDVIDISFTLTKAKSDVYLSPMFLFLSFWLLFLSFLFLKSLIKVRSYLNKKLFQFSFALNKDMKWNYGTTFCCQSRRYHKSTTSSTNIGIYRIMATTKINGGRQYLELR